MDYVILLRIVITYYVILHWNEQFSRNKTSFYHHYV